MKRLAVAAVLAMGVHAALFAVRAPRSRPLLPISPSRVVDISLVTFQRPVETPVAPPPEKVRPKPPGEPARPRKPVPKPVVHPRPAPQTVQSEAVAAPAEPTPMPPAQTFSSEPEPVAQPEDAPPSDAEQAAIRISVPLYDLNPPPVYPRIARRRNYQGTVLLDVRVTADGGAAEVKLARSSGYPVLDQSALAAVQTWRFEPARRGTRPVETWVQVPVRFELTQP